jgi:poly-gamma-glutamate biosynthesis protein PgsC/CapC
MHDYLFGTEPVRLAFVLGILASMLYYERREVTTGSIVVPGYIALFLPVPTVLLTTFANAFLSHWLIHRQLSKRVLLYGRTRFMALAITSMAIQTVLVQISPHGSWLWESDIPLWVGIGYVIPALIAHDMDRQGIGNTVRAVLTTGTLVAVPVMLALFWIPRDTEATAPLANFDAVLLPPEWMPFAVLLSAGTAWALLHNHGLRQGGFIGAAYVGMLWASPGQVVFVGIVAVGTWLVVTRLLMPSMILFGRRKFASMLVIAGLLSWVLLWIGVQILGVNSTAYATIASIPLTPVFVPGLLANDMERSSVSRVILGTTLGALFVIPATLLTIAVVTGAGTGGLLLYAVATVGSATFVFWQQLIWVARRFGLRAARVGDGLAYAALGREPRTTYDVRRRPRP